MRYFNILSIFLMASSVYAEVIDIYFGTGGGEAQGIYHTTFKTEKGRLGNVSLAAKVASPGFMAWNADKSRLYSISNDKQSPSVVAYDVQSGSKLKEINRVPMETERAAHIAVHPSEKFLAKKGSKKGVQATIHDRVTYQPNRQPYSFASRAVTSAHPAHSLGPQRGHW